MSTSRAPHRRQDTWLAALLVWLMLAVLWWVSSNLTHLPPWAWLLGLLMLAALPAWGLWLSFMLRRRIQRLQFAESGWISGWLARPWWPAVKAVVLALVLMIAALWQGYFLAPWEWGLLAMAPLLYRLVWPYIHHRMAPQFSEAAYAWAWSQGLAKWLLLLVLGGLWAALMLGGVLADRPITPTLSAKQLDDAISAIQAAPSGLVRWGLDGLLAVQVAGDTLRDLPKLPALRLALLALTGPGLMTLCVTAMLQGATGLQHDLRQAARLRPSSPPAAQAALLAFIAVVCGAIGLSTVANLDGLARQYPSPLALQRLPQCDRIDGQLYTIGSIDALRGIAHQALARSQTAPALCQQLHRLNGPLDAAVERYLDWYFSLGAEWGRVLKLLTGGAEGFLQSQLEQAIAKTPGLPEELQRVQHQGTQAKEALDAARQRIDLVLAKHRLAWTDGQCLVQAETSLQALPALGQLDQARLRLGASAVTGLGAGGFASAIAAKAMGKAGMKAAAKVLTKAAAKQGASRVGAGVSGAALGTVVPVVGTIAGALAGVVVSVSIDWTLLRAEEKLTREDMRADLRAAVHEHLDGMRQTLGCTQP